MRLANLNGRATIVTDHGATDVETATGGRFGPRLPDLFDRWAEFRSTPVDTGNAAPFDVEELGPPSPEPRQVFAIGLNYRSHAEETGRALPKRPATFTKFPTSLAGPYDAVTLPRGTVDWEVELVAVIGLRAERVNPARAWEHVAGLTVGQDLSERGLQFEAGQQFSLGKSFARFAPTGPWLVTPDELDHPDDLALGCSLDGETMQSSRTSDLIFSVPQLIAELSSVLVLLPGDLIFTGTPAGVGMARNPPRFLQPNQTLESWIEGIGTIRNRFVASGH